MKNFLTPVYCLTLAFCLFVNPLRGQDFEQKLAAFEKSYEYEKNGEYVKAIEELKNIYDAGSYEINLRLGWLNYLSGLFTESSANYQRAITIMPFSIEARLGYVYPASAMGNWSSVKTQYFSILEIDPQNTIANYRLGQIFYGAEEYQSAFKYFEKVVNLYPFDYDSVIMYAWTNYKLGKMREAEVLFRRALLIRPNDASAKEGLGYLK